MSRRSPLLKDVQDRLERAETCSTSLQERLVEYHRACSKENWQEAERLRPVILETVDGMLDAVAAVFKRLEIDLGK